MSESSTSSEVRVTWSTWYGDVSSEVTGMGVHWASSMMVELKELEKLGKHNYAEWSVEVESILETYDCLDMVVKTHHPDQFELDRLLRVKHSTVRRFLLRSLERHIKDLVDGHIWCWEIWEGLENFFCSEVVDRSEQIMREKYSLRVQEGEEFTNQYWSDSELALITNKRETARSSGWVLSSGATSHVCYQKELFTEITSASILKTVRCVSGSLTPVVGVGKVPITFSVDGRLEKGFLHNVLYVPGYTTNLVSVHCLMERGMDVCFLSSKKKCVIQKDGRVICYFVPEGKLFRLLEAEEQKPSAMVENETNSLKLWHLRLGQSNCRTLENVSVGLKVERGRKLDFCPACAEGEVHKMLVPTKVLNRTSGLLDLVHSYVGAYLGEKSISGAACFVSFVDDYSRKSFVYLMKHRNEVLDMFKKFAAMVERQTGRKIRRFRSDGGKEYQNQAFLSFLEEREILMEMTVRDSASQNGVAERVNHTLINKALSMVRQAKLQHSFWGAAVNTANYLGNVSPTIALDGMTPEERWSGKKPNLSHLRVFGCPAYLHTPKEQRGKFEKRAEKLTFIGYEEGLKGEGFKEYLLFNPQTRQVTRSRDVLFDELGTLSSGKEGTEVRSGTCHVCVSTA